MKRIRISNELKIGVATIAAILVLYFGIQYLKGINMLQQGQNFYLICSNVEGLTVSSHVKLEGFQVGLVRGIEYDYEHTGKIIVCINVNDALQVPRDSKALVQTDLLGTSTVVLQLGQSSDYYQTNDTILGGERAPGMLDAAQPMLASVSALIPKIDTLVSGMNVLVHDSKLQESMLQVNQLTEQLNRTVRDLNRMMQNEVPDILNNVSSATASLDTIAAQVKDADLDAMLVQANEALHSLHITLDNLQNSETTVGKLLTTDELHQQLTQTIAGVDSLIEDIKQNPKRYINIRVFGK